MVAGAVEDAFQIAGARRSGFDAMVDVDPGRRRAVLGAHREPVAAVTRRDALGAVERGKVVVGHSPDHPVYLAAGERLDGGDPALVDEPVMVGQSRTLR